MERLFKPFSRVVVVLLILFVLYSSQLLGHSVGPSIIFIDVGQGDAALLTFPNEFEIVIDGGPESDFIHKLHKFISVDSIIDILVVTHNHQDHSLGIVEVIRRHDINTLVLPTSCFEGVLLETIVNEANYNNLVYTNFIDITYLEGSLTIDYGDEVSRCTTNSKDVNNSSVVLQLEYNRSRFLFTGDAEKEREESLLASGILKENIELLKAGHHCSDSSSTFEFIDYLKPKVVVCSYGKDNKYGHPGYRLVQMLTNMGIERVDTALNGDIIINLE